MSQRIVWTVKTRGIELRTDEVSSVGFHVQYLDRECDIHIFLPNPIKNGRSETEFARDEFRRLRDALDNILSEPSR